MWSDESARGGRSGLLDVRASEPGRLAISGAAVVAVAACVLGIRAGGEPNDPASGPSRDHPASSTTRPFVLAPLVAETSDLPLPPTIESTTVARISVATVTATDPDTAVDTITQAT